MTNSTRASVKTTLSVKRYDLHLTWLLSLHRKKPWTHYTSTILHLSRDPMDHIPMPSWLASMMMMKNVWYLFYMKMALRRLFVRSIGRSWFVWSRLMMYALFRECTIPLLEVAHRIINVLIEYSWLKEASCLETHTILWCSYRDPCTLFKWHTLDGWNLQSVLDMLRDWTNPVNSESCTIPINLYVLTFCSWHCAV